MTINDEQIYEPPQRKIILQGNTYRFVKKTLAKDKAKLDVMFSKLFYAYNISFAVVEICSC